MQAAGAAVLMQLTSMLYHDKVITQYTIFKSFFIIPLHK
jgi:hypothetical protein